MRACIKFCGNLMHVSGILSGGIFMWEGAPPTWMMDEVGEPPWPPAMGGGCPALPLKAPLSSSHLTPPHEGSLSPSRIYSPWSRTSEIHVPGGFSARKSCAFAASLERGGGGCSVPRTCVRARMRCWFAALGLPLDLEIGTRSSTWTTSWTR